MKPIEIDEKTASQLLTIFEVGEDATALAEIMEADSEEFGSFLREIRELDNPKAKQLIEAIIAYENRQPNVQDEQDIVRAFALAIEEWMTGCEEDAFVLDDPELARIVKDAPQFENLLSSETSPVSAIKEIAMGLPSWHGMLGRWTGVISVVELSYLETRRSSQARAGGEEDEEDDQDEEVPDDSAADDEDEDEGEGEGEGGVAEQDGFFDRLQGYDFSEQIDIFVIESVIKKLPDHVIFGPPYKMAVKTYELVNAGLEKFLSLLGKIGDMIDFGWFFTLLDKAYRASDILAAFLRATFTSVTYSRRAFFLVLLAIGFLMNPGKRLFSAALKRLRVGPRAGPVAADNGDGGLGDIETD